MASPATWKRGRQASQRSLGRGSRTAAQASALAAWLPCVSRAPRARPVVPEVKTIVAGAARSTAGRGARSGASAVELTTEQALGRGDWRRSRPWQARPPAASFDSSWTSRPGVAARSWAISSGMAARRLRGTRTAPQAPSRVHEQRPPARRPPRVRPPRSPGRRPSSARRPAVVVAAASSAAAVQVPEARGAPGASGSTDAQVASQSGARSGISDTPPDTVALHRQRVDGHAQAGPGRHAPCGRRARAAAATAGPRPGARPSTARGPGHLARWPPGAGQPRRPRRSRRTWRPSRACPWPPPGRRCGAASAAHPRGPA